jgi:hypothetical protein
MNDERPYFRYTIELDDGSTKHVVYQHVSENRAIKGMKTMAENGVALPDIGVVDNVHRGWVFIPAHRIKLISVRRLP